MKVTNVTDGSVHTGALDLFYYLNEVGGNYASFRVVCYCIPDTYGSHCRVLFVLFFANTLICQLCNPFSRCAQVFVS